MKKNCYMAAIAIGIISCFCFAKCEKDKPDSNGLPPATQEGKNTLGFLLNGVPWTPKGSNGTANLSIDFDEGINNGIFSISSYSIENSGNRSYFGLGVKDSLNFIATPQKFDLRDNSILGFYYSYSDCTYDYFSDDIVRTGTLLINKLDRTNRIISGTFNATLSKQGCETIKITEGRFDMKY